MAKAATVDDYIEVLDDPFQAIATTLRPIIDAGLPALKPVLWHGQPVWMNGKRPVAMIKAYPRYVSFALFEGRGVKDRSGRLGAGSGQISFVKLSTANQIDAKLLGDLAPAGAGDRPGGRLRREY